MSKYRRFYKSNSTNILQASKCNNFAEKEQLLHEIQIHQTELELQNKELQESQYQLEESRNRYAELYDFAPIGYANLDTNGIILDINLTGARLLGTERSWVLSKPFALFVAKNNLNQFRNHLRQCTHADEQIISELKLLVGVNKELLWIEMSSIVVKDSVWRNTVYRTVFGDITKRKLAEEALDKAYGELEIRVAERTTDLNNQILERKRAEAALAVEKQFLNRTLYSVGDGVITTNTAGIITIFNRIAESITGWSQAEASGELFSRFFYVKNNKTNEVYEDIVKNTLKNGETHLPDDTVLVTKELFEVPVEVHSSPIKAINGAHEGVVIVFRDITEKQKIEVELIKAEKMESIGVLAGGIAHDFNNILAAILANIQLAVVKLKNNEDIKPYLMHTIETARKASDLTNQLLTFSKGGSPVRKQASLVELIKDTAEFVLRGANTKPVFAIAADLWVADIDAGQINQVIHNLVLNAKQAMSKGGMVYISAENISIEESTHFNPGNYVKITVKDQGVGIAKENLSRIFDPFFTTKKEGNGLGLAISYSIIKQHDGYIEVKSREDAGTTFFVYLPASNMAVIQTETQAKTAVSGGIFKILVMDDEEILLNAVGEMLKCYGYQVSLTTDGVAAIELYKQAKLLGEPFDVVIMDLTIPGGMGGQEAIAYLRDFDPRIKAIVSSGYATDPIMAEYERFGFAGVACKPYKIDELDEVLRKVINHTAPY